MRGKLATVIDQIEHGHHVFRAYFKHAVLKQYEKFSTFLRNELCSNNLTDFGLRKGLDHLDEVRQTFQTITSRFAGFQAQWDTKEFSVRPMDRAMNNARQKVLAAIDPEAKVA